MGVGSSILFMSKMKSNRKIKYVESVKHVEFEKVNPTPPPGIRGKSLKMWNSPRPIKNINK